MKKNLGKRLKAAREAKGISQTELAEKLKLGTGQNVSNWERGATTVPRTSMAKVCRILGLDLKWLFFEYYKEKALRDWKVISRG